MNRSPYTGKIMIKFFTVLLTLLALAGRGQTGITQLAFTSDLHYGILRTHFRNADSVASTVVNRAMLATINRLPGERLPVDSGVGAGNTIGYIDGLLITGDIANRQEKGIQSAAISWSQFIADYMPEHDHHGLTTTDRHHLPTPVFLTPGNHDASDAIGFYKKMSPATDATTMAGMYNMMMHPSHPLTAADYNYATDRIHYSRDIGGVHLLFVQLWPDSAERSWIRQDLAHLGAGIPVLLFTHSMPDVESRFFTNPNGDHSVNNIDKFENLLPEYFSDGEDITQPALSEQRDLAVFLKQHPAIKAWFHGHSNYGECYEWQGPDAHTGHSSHVHPARSPADSSYHKSGHKAEKVLGPGVSSADSLNLPCFRVDSPMKGKLSSADETLLSFMLISIDPGAKTLTVRECLWNSAPDDPAVIKWGRRRTIPLIP